MTKQEAIEILRDAPIDIRSTREDDIHTLYATAQGMAIEALSNTPNTFNTLESLEITDKQINMAIGAIRYMLNNGYQSEDMEDALQSAIKVLAEAERGEGMMFFKDRKVLADKAEQWMEENHVAKTSLGVISYLEATGWLKLDNNSTKVDNENVDLISRRDAIEECKLEFLNPNVERETEEQTLIDQSFAKGWNQANSIWIKALEKLPSAQPEPLTDKEQSIFLAAMERERKVCKQVDEEWRDCREPYEDSLVRTCHEITRKVKGALWDGK